MELFPDHETIPTAAWLIGERIDVRALGVHETLSVSPLTFRIEEGVAVVFRYGAVVLFGIEGSRAQAFLDSLGPFVSRPLPAHEFEEAAIRLDAAAGDGVEADGTPVLRDASLARLQVVAFALARSTLLSHYESQLAEALDRVEIPVEELRRRGRTRLGGREILRQLGEVLSTETRMIVRAEVTEKPELVWERPELDRLYVRLAEEYELEVRDRAIARKLEMLARASATFLELLQNRRSLHVEWYIVTLILVEIVILLYDLFGRTPS